MTREYVQKDADTLVKILRRANGRRLAQHRPQTEPDQRKEVSRRACRNSRYTVDTDGPEAQQMKGF